jgi:hypothetical protein
MINITPVADTHEHLVEERDRLENSENSPLRDIGAFFTQYVDSDLVVAGMPEPDIEKVQDSQIPSNEKWNLVKPFWEKMRSTGYGMMVRESIHSLFNLDDVTDDNWESIDAQLRALPEPGYYQRILKGLCNLDHCQVNALDVPLFRDTDDPELLKMDLCVTTICSGFEPKVVVDFIGRDIKTLDDCIEAVDKAFDTYGTRAIAVKNQSAYRRRIDYQQWELKDVEECVRHCVKKKWDVQIHEQKPLEDFLFHRSVEKAVEYNLPYKMHTGFHAGRGTMRLHHVRHNAGDMCELCTRHPDANFVFMHITYPYQDEAIALAKHYANAYIDMCWSWMISPLAAVRFLKECLLAVPTNKIFTFGGDVSLVELVPGHIRIARKGIAQAISELLEQGWLRNSDVPHVIERLLHQNAHDLFQQRV